MHCTHRNQKFFPFKYYYFYRHNNNMKKVLFTFFFAITAGIVLGQQKLQGTIVDNSGQPVIGATVQVKGTSTHAVADVNGAFVLTTDKNFPFTIIFSSVGFKSQELELYEFINEPIEVILKEDNLLSEVVVTARRRSETAQE